MGTHIHLYIRLICFSPNNRRYTFAADMESRTTPELGAAVRTITRTFVADFVHFVSLEFPAVDGNAGIETVSLATVQYWLPPVKWITSRINLAVLAGKAYPNLGGRRRNTRRACTQTSTKLGPDCMAESKLPYIYDPHPDHATDLPLMDRRDERGTVICTTDTSLNIRPASYVEVPQQESQIKLEAHMPTDGGKVLFVFGKGGFL